jgi:DNA-binding transcriptional regulator YiaG
MTIRTQRRISRRRGGHPRAPGLSRPDYPFVMKLPDGRRLFVEIPGRWVAEDRGGEPAFVPEAVEFLDKIQAMATSISDRAPSPAFITALREGLGLTQRQLGQRIGVDKMTVSRWERGELRPGPESLAALEKVRREATHKGVIVAG